jgi:hypothetical protein
LPYLFVILPLVRELKDNDNKVIYQHASFPSRGWMIKLLMDNLVHIFIN